MGYVGGCLAFLPELTKEETSVQLLPLFTLLLEPPHRRSDSSGQRLWGHFTRGKDHDTERHFPFVRALVPYFLPRGAAGCFVPIVSREVRLGW